jgi:hypothetical protein
VRTAIWPTVMSIVLRFKFGPPEMMFASVRACSTGLVLLLGSGQGWGAESSKCGLEKFGEVEGSAVLEHGADHLRADR